MKKSVANVFFRQYVIQKVKRGNGNVPPCTFCRRPSTLIAQGMVYIPEVPSGLSFYEPVCDKDADVLRQGQWPGKERPEPKTKDLTTIVGQNQNQQEEIVKIKKSAKLPTKSAVPAKSPAHAEPAKESVSKSKPASKAKKSSNLDWFRRTLEKGATRAYVLDRAKIELVGHTKQPIEKLVSIVLGQFLKKGLAVEKGDKLFLKATK